MKPSPLRMIRAAADRVPLIPERSRNEAAPFRLARAIVQATGRIRRTIQAGP